MATATVPSTDTVSVLDALITRLEAAQCAFSKRQPVMAIQLLNKFVQEVQGHAGRRIDFEVANHLVAHAQAIMDSMMLMGIRPAGSRQHSSSGSVHTRPGHLPLNGSVLAETFAFSGTEESHEVA